MALIIQKHFLCMLEPKIKQLNWVNGHRGGFISRSPVLVHGRKRPETSLRHKDTEKVMNYFPGLANWPVGENKKMTF